MEIKYKCEDCGADFTAKKKVKVVKCKKCKIRLANCKAKGKEYIPLNKTEVDRVDRTEEQQVATVKEANEAHKCANNAHKLTPVAKMLIYFFQNYQEEVESTTKQIKETDWYLLDKRHEIELGDLSDTELIRNGREQENALKRRRNYKDYLEELEVFYNLYREMTETGILEKLETAQKQLEELETNRQNRKYAPRQDENMKEYDWCYDKMMSLDKIFKYPGSRNTQYPGKGMAFKIVYGNTPSDRRAKYKNNNYYVLYADNGTKAVLAFSQLLSEMGKTYVTTNIQAFPFTSCTLTKQEARQQTSAKIEQDFSSRLEV